MATNTYTALDKATVSGSTTNTVTFSSIPSGYTDLVIVANGYTLTADISQRIRFNSDTGTNYSLTYLGGNGSSASSGRTSSGTGIYANYLTGWTSTSTQPSNWIFQVMNYSNTTTNKTILSRANTATGGSYPGTEAIVGLWRSTAAITSISIEAGYSSSHYFAAGSTFSLYGIKAEPVYTAKATGGTIYYGADGYTYHKFTAGGTFAPTQSLSCDVLVVAGGGGGAAGTNGGGYYGGGGGAGGVSYLTPSALTATNYTVVVGAGGAGTQAATGGTGTNSSFNASIISNGGGGGGWLNVTGPTYNLGANGGSGGGSVNNGTTTVATSTQGSTGGAIGYGNSGGYGTAGGGNNTSGGGGGAGAAGANGVQNVSAGAGGAGLSTWSIWASATSSGVSGFFAGGGGGAGQGGLAGAGGAGGGGAANGNGIGTAGTANTGGGGGGGNNNGTTAQGGAGGSGIVIIRYVSA